MLPHKIKNVKSKMCFFVEQETLCGSAVTDKAFDIHAVNG